MSKTVEEWRDIKGFEGLYQVSDWGNVRSLEKKCIGRNQYGTIFSYKKKGKILKPSFDRDGYLILGLRKDGVRKNAKVHRLVAEAFLPNPENKPIVGHTKTLDNGLEDKTANEAWNLQWMTPEENSNFGTLPQRVSERFRGENSYWYGKHFSDEMKRKMSLNNKKCKKVFKYSLNDELLEVFNSIRNAAKSMGCDHRGLARCCNGEYKQYVGYKWKFSE